MGNYSYSVLKIKSFVFPSNGWGLGLGGGGMLVFVGYNRVEIPPTLPYYVIIHTITGLLLLKFNTVKDTGDPSLQLFTVIHPKCLTTL